MAELKLVNYEILQPCTFANLPPGMGQARDVEAALLKTTIKAKRPLYRPDWFSVFGIRLIPKMLSISLADFTSLRFHASKCSNLGAAFIGNQIVAILVQGFLVIKM